MDNKRFKILLIEDNPGDARLIREMLAEAGEALFDLECADRLQTGLEHIAEGDIDVILLDLGLPDSQGLDTLSRVLAEPPKVPVTVVLTGLDDEALAVQAVRKGAQDYLVKGQIDSNLLVRALRYAIERKRAEERIKHLNGVLRTIRSVNQLIVREKNRDRLLQDACACLIETRSYHNAWIVLLDESGGLVTTVEAGLGKGFLPMIEHMERGEWPACGQEALARPDVVAIKDPPSTCADCPLTANCGGGRAMTVRLEHGERTYGLLSVSIPADFATAGEEQSLFKEVAEDIAFALHSIGLEEKRKRAEGALRGSEERYRAVVEYQTDLICRFLPDSTLTFVNESYCRYHGKQREDLVGHSFMPFILQDDREKASEHLASFSQKTPVATIEYRVVAAGGKVRWQQWINRPIFDERGSLIEFQAVGRDITERKQAEEERDRLLAQIQEQAQRVQQIMDTVPEGVLLLDAAGQVILANPVGRKDLADLSGAKVGDTLIHLGDRSLVELLTSPPQGLWHEVTIPGSDLGETSSSSVETLSRAAGDLPERSFELIARPLDTGMEAGDWVLVIRDVTQEREIQRRVQRQERLAAVGQLAGGIAHDFNNLLTTIMLYAQMPLSEQDLPPNLNQAFETILDESRQAAKLVQQILDFSRRSPIKTHLVDLKPFAKEAVRVLERTIPESIRLRFEAGSEKYVVNADPTRIQQVLMNLVVNARDAMPEGGELRIDLSRVKVGPDEKPPVVEMSPGEWICLAVSDTGAGIPPEVLSHLFEPFFTTKEPGKGTGLGLAQVHGIVVQHEGHIGVETEVGKGTAFRVYLPACQAGEEEIPQQETALAAPDGQGEIILLVEDNEGTRRAGRRLLESLGYRVLAAANGQEALEVYGAAGEEIDLVITDVVMPEMGGRRLMRELRKANPGLKVLAVTGYVVEEDIHQLKEGGFLDVVHKPFDVETLAQVIRRALDED